MLRAYERLCGLVLLFCAGLALADPQPVQINGVRLWRAPDNTRLVFDLSGPVDHQLFTLDAPNRVVIDMEGVTLNTALNKLSLNNTPIRVIRPAQNTPSQVRIVIYLSASVTPKSFTLAPNHPYGHRLVVDLFDKVAVQGSAPPARQSVPVTSPPPSGRTRSGDIIVAIDAGHGGEDPGASGPNGLREKQVVLQIAREVKRQIDSEKGFRAELVRTGDYFIPLRKRTEIARRKNADLFVSIHADAAPSRSASGASVYALSSRGATSETARWLADTENRSDLIGGVGGVSLGDKDQMLAGVLLDLSMTATLTASLNVGQDVMIRMGKVTRLHKRKVEQAGFMVLKSPDIPSILVETGFISNPAESRKLASVAHQKALAVAVKEGVKNFFYQYPPSQTDIARLRDQKQPPASGGVRHKVTSGESLGLIAKRYGVSVTALRQANRLSSDTIKVSQTLIIPAGDNR